MADPKGKDKPKPPAKDLFEELVVLVFILLILSALFAQFALFSKSSSFQYLPFSAIWQYILTHIIPILKLIGFILSVVFSFGIAWSMAKLTAVTEELNALYNPSAVLTGEAGSEKAGNIKWERVMGHMNSSNPNDWKFAIIEADIMLSELLDTLGLLGETMADKLKNVAKGSFQTIESAWEAHKVRNTIAHEGGDYVISEREARRVIGLYKTVFEEFNVI